MLEVGEYQGGFRDRVDSLMVCVERGELVRGDRSTSDGEMGRSICGVRIRWCSREFGGTAGGGRGIVGLMSVELIRASRLTGAVPYAYASVVPAGARLVHTAGACPLDEHDRVVALGDVAGQAGQVMDNLEVALKAAGAVLTDVVRTTVYVASTDQADLVAAWNVVRARFGDHDAPSTLLGVTVLGYRGQLVEVDAVAVMR